MMAERSGRFGRWLWLWSFGYVGLMVAVAWSLLAVRDWALAEMSTLESVENWEAWREGVRVQQTEPSPVQRRVPQSAEPPALVLMRDYFGVSLAGAVLFSTLLYWVIAWLVTGMLSSSHEFGDLM
jgi:hypothetical protein